MSLPIIDWSELSLQVMITFAHFLWQACVVGLVLLVVERVGESLRDSPKPQRDLRFGDTGSRRASTRYTFACLAFFALPVCAVTTFGWVHQSHGPIVLAASDPIESPPIPVVIANEPAHPLISKNVPMLPPLEVPAGAVLPVTEPLDEPSVAVSAESWTERFQSLAPYLLIAYIVGVGVMLTRFGLSVMGSSRLRRTLQPIADSNLLRIIAAQSSRPGLKRVPIVALCQRVTVPVVVGILKPAILLPPALVCGLDPNQLAAILSHEMAHIRRYDLLVNLLQRIVEALLFFHPVTWWISRRVSIERENCCDDMAAAGCGRIEYVAALLSMAEQCAAIRELKITPQLESLAADGGDPSQLGYRIERLLGEDHKPRVSLTRSATMTIALAAGFAGLFMIAVAQSGGDDPADTPAASIAEWGDESHGLRCRIVPVSPSMDAENVDLSVSQHRFESSDDMTFAVEIQNVGNEPIELRDIRYGEGFAEGTRRTSNANHYAPHLFDFTFTNAAGKAVARTQREFVLPSHAHILHGGLITEIEPRRSITCLLKLAKFKRSMGYRLTPGNYRVKVRYRGPDHAVRGWIAEHMKPQKPDKTWPHQVTSNFASFLISADGFRQSDLVWGGQTNGLRAALDIRVPHDSGIASVAPGVLPETSLHAMLHVKNVSNKPITFVSETGRQGDTLRIRTANGEEVKVKGAFFWGLPLDVRWTIQPGEVADLDVLTPSLNQGLSPGEYSTRDTIRFNSRQLRDKDGNQTFPAPDDYQSEIDTGWTPLFLSAPDQLAADKSSGRPDVSADSVLRSAEEAAKQSAPRQGDKDSTEKLNVVATLPRRYELTFDLVDAETGAPIRDAAILYKEDESTWYGGKKTDYETGADWFPHQVIHEGKSIFKASTSQWMNVAHVLVAAKGYGRLQLKLNESLQRGKPVVKPVKMRAVDPVGFTLTTSTGRSAFNATVETLKSAELRRALIHKGGYHLKRLLDVDTRSDQNGDMRFAWPAFSDWTTGTTADRFTGGVTIRSRRQEAGVVRCQT